MTPRQVGDDQADRLAQLVDQIGIVQAHRSILMAQRAAEHLAAQAYAKGHHGAMRGYEMARDRLHWDAVALSVTLFGFSGS